MKLEKTKIEYLGVQEGIGNIPKMILVNVSMPCKDFKNGMSTVVYNPFTMQLSFPDKLKMLRDLNLLIV